MKTTWTWLLLVSCADSAFVLWYFCGLAHAVLLLTDACYPESGATALDLSSTNGYVMTNGLRAMGINHQQQVTNQTIFQTKDCMLSHRNTTVTVKILMDSSGKYK